MIARLRGILAGTAADHVVIDVNGVGYLVHASSRTLSALGGTGEEATLHIVTQVSQDDIRLIGFATGEERDWFGLLTSVQGVGTRVALAILSALAVDELQRRAAARDSATIARANEDGPQVAQRIAPRLCGKAARIARRS